MDDREFLTVKELGDYLRIGKTNAYDLVSKPDFPSIKLGRKYIIPRKELEQWTKKYLYKEYII